MAFEKECCKFASVGIPAAVLCFFVGDEVFVVDFLVFAGVWVDGEKFVFLAVDSSGVGGFHLFVVWVFVHLRFV